MKILLILIYRFNAILIKIPAGFSFAEMEKLILKFTQKYKVLGITKTILKKNRVWRFTFPDFKSYYKATVIKTYDTDTHIKKHNRLRVQKKRLTFMVNWFLTMLLVQLNICMQKNEVGLLPNIILQN